MPAALSSLDWSLVQAFVAVVEAGSLSGAARSLGRSQPTLGRQIKSMEDQLGSELFQRHEKGLHLTAVGESLRDAAQVMLRAAKEIELLASSQDQGLTGTVRVTASVIVATHHLPKLIAEVREREPQVAIELVASDESSNLHFREADIAVRMYRPTQLDLVAVHLGDLELGVFAARSYVERRGMPREPSELLEHDVVGFDREPAILEGFARAGLPVERDFFKVRCDHQAAHWELVRAGCGLGFGQLAVGRDDPLLVEIPLAIALPRLPVWLTAHDAMRHTPRVARVWELLAAGLRRVCEHRSAEPS
jgi:DNA-binding transcriptional LysR family regulator